MVSIATLGAHNFDRAILQALCTSGIVPFLVFLICTEVQKRLFYPVHAPDLLHLRV